MRRAFSTAPLPWYACRWDRQACTCVVRHHIPSDFEGRGEYAEYLHRVAVACIAVAGAVWLKGTISKQLLKHVVVLIK